MANFLAMKISDSLSNLAEEVNDHLFWKYSLLTFVFDILIKADT
jgi:hypothetical protein